MKRRFEGRFEGMCEGRSRLLGGRLAGLRVYIGSKI